MPRLRYQLRTLLLLMALVVIVGLTYQGLRPGPIVFPAKGVLPDGRVEYVWILAKHEKHEVYSAVAWGWKREDFPKAEERDTRAYYDTWFGVVRRYPYGNPYELANKNGQYLTYVVSLNDPMFDVGTQLPVGQYLKYVVSLNDPMFKAGTQLPVDR